MYTVVLMTALATTTTSPAWHFRSHCHCSCAAPVYSCHGCSGCHGCHAPVIQGYGWAGGCYGYHGGCYGGYGIVSGDPYNVYGGCTGCFGCFGGHSGYGVPVPMDVKVQKKPVVDPYPPINPKKEKDGAEEIGPLKEKVKKPKLDDEAKAKVRIEIPVGGKLFVDGQHINVAAGTRVFQTPALAPGQTYFYDIRIEVERDGATRREERRIVIRPGEDALVRFPTLQPAAIDTARVPR